MKKLIIAGLLVLIGIVYTLGFYSGYGINKADIVHVDSLVYDCPGYDDLIQTCDSVQSWNYQMQKENDSLRESLFWYKDSFEDLYKKYLKITQND